MFIWTIGDIGNVVLGCLVFLVFLFMALKEWMKQWMKQIHCKHDGGINGTRSCDAICRKCGKNLGFIGSWRKNHEH